MARLFAVGLLVAGLGLARAERAIDEGFEGQLPDFHTYRSEYSADTTHVHGGERALRVKATQSSSLGGAYFRLDGMLDYSSDYEYSVWVYSGKGADTRVYISADGGRGRYTVSSSKGRGVEGQWVQLRGVVYANQWRESDKELMMALTTTDVSWFDDVILRKVDAGKPPIELWPESEVRLRAEADKRVTRIRAGQEVELSASQGVLMPSVGERTIVVPDGDQVKVAAEGVLIFALEVEERVYLHGEVELEHESDLRPGIRCLVLGNDSVIGAPMVSAEPWQNVGGRSTGVLPDVQGGRPETRVRLERWYLNPGRHYLSITGPHIRSAGVFRGLRLRATERVVEAPLYTFAFFTDTHLGSGRSEWMNIKMCGPAAEALTTDLRLLKAEGVDFAIIGGDMVDNGRPEQVEALAEVIKSGGLPVYGVMGNHEAFTAGSRKNFNEVIPGLFPGGETQYVLYKEPLRFIMLDGCWWYDSNGELQAESGHKKGFGMRMRPEELEWLEQRLAEDTKNPTVVVWHFPFLLERGVASSGKMLGKRFVQNEAVNRAIMAHPNVVATLNGHFHYNTVESLEGIVGLQNAAFVEWPNFYRVLRVYSDRVEWEVRQTHNRGFITEGVLPHKGLVWMASVKDGDLEGTFRLAPRKRQ